ncbi:MAG TPA: GNAT family N-acetyltransferase [Dysgonamonadaceae bacterium]|nr:GNAT family N-acetyltransferase [Dysgonamonadaceae bacterium]
MEYQLKIFYNKEELPDLENVSFFHSVSLFDLYKGISYYTPLMVVCFENNVPVASIFAHIKRINRLLDASIFKRCYVSQKPAYYGSDLPEEEIFALLLSTLIEEMKYRVFYVEVRNLGDPIFGYKAFRDNNFFSIKWINIKNSLQRKRKIWNQLSRSRKNQVNKAKRKGIYIEELETAEMLPTIYKLIDKNISWKFSHRFPPYTFFENFFQYFILKGKGKIFIAKHEEKVIGGIIVGLHKNKNAYSIYYWGKTKTYKNLHPTIFTIWYAMDYAEKNGFKYFDFMDSGYIHEKAGKPRFLLQFGGKQHATRRWYKFNWKWINYLLSKFYD